MGARSAVPRFHRHVYALVRRVPRGRVVTYGQVAAILGHPRAARAVGTALGALRGTEMRDVPWHRVLNAAGRCSHRHGGWAVIQQDLLEREGVAFSRAGRCDLTRVRWPGPKRVKTVVLPLSL